jgi:hypothetical protein
VCTELVVQPVVGGHEFVDQLVGVPAVEFGEVVEFFGDLLPPVDGAGGAGVPLGVEVGEAAGDGDRQAGDRAGVGEVSGLGVLLEPGAGGVDGVQDIWQ